MRVEKGVFKLAFISLFGKQTATEAHLVTKIHERGKGTICFLSSSWPKWRQIAPPPCPASFSDPQSMEQRCRLKTTDVNRACEMLLDEGRERIQKPGIVEVRWWRYAFWSCRGAPTSCFFKWFPNKEITDIASLHCVRNRLRIELRFALCQVSLVMWNNIQVRTINLCNGQGWEDLLGDT